MTVKDILILSSELIDRKDLSDYFEKGSSETSIDITDDAKIMLKCYNLIISQIISEYYRLTTVEQFNTENGILEYKNLEKNVFSIVKVMDENLNKINAKIYPTKLLTKVNTGYLEYEYIPKEQVLSDNFIFEKTPITNRVVALGVASEYLFIKGCFAESENYNRKFLNAVLSSISKSGKLVIPARKWF